MNNHPTWLSPLVQLVPFGATASALHQGGLRIKFGVDPTSPDLHLGHAVALKQLRKCQDAGHTVLLVIGNFTAAIGDPTGRSTTRPCLTQEQINNNAMTYLNQAFLILDKSKTEVHHNNDWLGSMTAAQVVAMASQCTVAQMSQRDDFSKRLTSNSPVSIHEFLYPLFQGQDSVHLKCDVEMGGTDQTFNLMMGRSMQEKLGQPPQGVMTVPLLVGLDGTLKMSKSSNNHVGLLDSPIDKFNKIMGLSDTLIPSWGELLTDIPQSCWEERLLSENPKNVKMDLALNIVSSFDGEEAALAAKTSWEGAVLTGKASSNLEVLEVTTDGNGISLVELLVMSGLASSKNVAKQKIAEGAVRLNGLRLTSIHEVLPVSTTGLLQVGKKNFKSISVSQPEVAVRKIRNI